MLTKRIRNLFEVLASEETFYILLKGRHTETGTGAPFFCEFPNRPYASHLVCVCVCGSAHTPEGSPPGRGRNEKLFTMTPNTWHIRSVKSASIRWLVDVLLFMCVTSVLFDVINVKRRTSSESCCHVSFNSSPRPR